MGIFLFAWLAQILKNCDNKNALNDMNALDAILLFLCSNA